MNLLSQDPKCSTEPSTKGFDLAAGNKWIYPQNFPVREYQFQIVNTCLFHNTLVCLPTGLGKTFIAAVVMYNYWRWYPQGIIVFLAPTRPLVAQQIHACHTIMGIPVSQTIELTGQTSQAKRKSLWREKRVIFATPQTFQKDLMEGIVPTQFLKCVVVDEAHKALGKHAYCESIRLLNEKNQFYRLLALSATPGNKIEDVVQMINNLGISRLELRDDKSPDITPYINEKTQEIVSVGLGDDLAGYHERYMAIIDPRLRMIITNKLLPPSARRVSKGYIHAIMDRLKNRPDKPGNFNVLMKVLYELLSLCHAGDLMLNHGLRAFHEFFEAHRNDKNKTWIQRELDLLQLLDDIQEFLGPFPDLNLIENGTLKMVPDNIMFGHAKFAKLRDIIESHFTEAQSKGTDTRVIVFVEYRNSAYEVYVLLLKLQPLIRPQMFMGQAGQTRKVQVEALENFRSNKVNVLISTSVGEEGLDIGEVDLIVCFDNLYKSPTRLVQRMGRTGRKRSGRTIILVTDGTEHHTLKNALSRRDSLNSKVRHSEAVHSALVPNSPRMVPAELNPVCLKMLITVLPVTPKGQKPKNKLVKKGKSAATTSKSTKSGPQKSSTEEQRDITHYFTPPTRQEEPIDDPDLVPMKMEVVRVPRMFAQSNKDDVNRIKYSDVKLLTSSDASIEFLMLRTIEQSLKDIPTEEKSFTVSLTPPPIPENIDELLNEKTPPLSALDILATLEPYVAPVSNDSDEFIENTNSPEPWDNSIPSINSSPVELVNSQPVSHPEGYFEDLCDESDDEMVLSAPGLQTNGEVEWISGQDVNNPDISELNTSDNIKKNSPPSNLRITGFEDILDELSNEESQNLDNMSDDSVTELALDLSKSVSDSSERRKSSKPVSSTPIRGGDCSILEKNIPSSPLQRIYKENSCSTRKPVNGYEEANSTFHDLNSTLFDCDIADRTLNQMNEVVISDEDSHDAEKMKNQFTAVNQLNNDRLMPDSTSSQWPKSMKASLENSNKNYDSDEDIFDSESMIIDTDLLKQIEQLENPKIITNKSNNSPLNESNVSTSIISHKNNEICQSSSENECIINSIAHHSRNNGINHEISQTKVAIPEKVDNCEWADLDDTEFDFSPDPIIESKYFSKSSNSTGSLNNSARKSLKFDESHLISSAWEKKNSFQETEKSENLPGSSKNISNVRQSIFSKFKSKRYNNSDSDDDFAQTKIIKPTFRRSENISDSEETFRDVSRHEENRLTIARDRVSTKLPEKTRNPAVISSTKLPSKSRTSPHGFPTLSPKRSSSLDTYSKQKHRSRRRDQEKKGFLLDEAEVSSDEYISSENSEEDEDDKDLEGFVSHSQHADTSVDMKAHYLQSIKSPRQPGKFFIRKPKTPPADVDIFSQTLGNETNTYLCDSFCVGSDAESAEENTSDDCRILEDIERKLSKKRKRKNSEDMTDKRRRIVKMSDSSEDETEQLRAQIAEESMMLKQL